MDSTTKKYKKIKKRNPKNKRIRRGRRMVKLSMSNLNNFKLKNHHNLIKMKTKQRKFES